MATIQAPVKTPHAMVELASRQRKLSQRHRTVLLLVDGRRDEEEVRALARAAGSPASCFDELIELGMISRPMSPEPEPAPRPELPDAPGPVVAPMHFELPAALGPDSVVSSMLPPSLTLLPESQLDSAHGPEGPVSESSDFDDVPRSGRDEALEEARAILLRAVRAEAPVAGSITVLRLRRARTREDLESLLEEVEARIFKPFKGLWASQTMARVRELLSRVYSD